MVGMDWIGLAQNRDKWRAPGFIKCREILEWLHNWWRLE
jgi:hypothetical protein